jgi:nucleoporin NDC1
MAKVSEVYGGRVSSAIIVSLIHQTCLLLAYSAFVDADPWHPFMWLSNWYLKQKCFNIILFILCMSVVTLLQVIFFSKRIIKGLPFSATRLMAVVNTFSLDNLFTLLLNVITGFAMGFAYIKVNKTCMKTSDDDYVFKLLLTSFTGAYFFIADYVNTFDCIQFPTVSGLSGKSQIKRLVMDCLNNSIYPGLKALFYFNMFYYCCGEAFGSIVVSLPGVNVSEDTSGYVSFTHLLNTWNFFSSYSLCLAVLTVLSTMRSLTTMLLSCSWNFPITAPENEHVLLCQGLSLTALPAVKQLASQDLKTIAETDPVRRAELYVLSQPGGHPHNWKSIIKPFLDTVDKMCTDLSLIPPKETVKTIPPSEDFNLIPQSPLVRNMSPGIITSRPQMETTPTACTTLSTKAREWLKQRIDLLLKKPPVAFVFGERTEARIAHALTLHGQSVANLVSAISTIVQASYTEDSFGVVQQDLPSLIIALLKLKSAIDKLGNLFRKPNKPSQSLPHLHIKSVLREATVRSIYKIVVVFKPHINDLLLPADVKKQLQGFTEFKES